METPKMQGNKGKSKSPKHAKNQNETQNCKTFQIPKGKGYKEGKPPKLQHKKKFKFPKSKIFNSNLEIAY